MIEKVVNNVEELNAAAAHLRQAGGLETLRKLAKAWAVPYGQTEDYIQGKRYRLAEIPIADKDFRTASEKLREEMVALDDKYFAGIIGWQITRSCESDEALAAQVLLKHKSLQRCLDFISGKAYELAAEQAKQKGLERVQANTGMVLSEKEVFPWAEEYYRKEDAEEAKKKAEEDKKEILSEWERKERPVIAGKTGKAGSGKAKKAAGRAAEKTGEPSAGKKDNAGTKEAKKGFEQMTLFELPQ